MNSKPTFQLVRVNNASVSSSHMNGGFSYGRLANNDPMDNATDYPNEPAHINDNDDQLNLYKARKYHYKCQAKVRNMMSQGQQCPTGFEKYLKPFSA